MVKRVSHRIFPYLSVLKGNISRSLGPIALGVLRKCSGYSLASPFSREIYQGHWVRSHMASTSQTHFMFNLYKGTSIGFPGIALPWLFSREKLKLENRRSHWIFLNLSVLKGNFEGGKQAILHSECFAIAHGVVDTVGSGAIALGL